MTFTLHFLPEVEEDVVAGYNWYERKTRGLGDEFLSVFYAAAERILSNPLLYPVAYDPYRRRLLRRFPYALYYFIKDNQVIIAGLFHCARDPHGIGTQLRSRK
jgi:toxin ParE1/3/4